MKKLMILFILLGCFIPNHTIAAEENTISLSVEPIYPENQDENVKGYFKLDVEPEERQIVELKLTNNLDQELRVLIKPANGFSNPSGGMLYMDKIESENSKLLEDAILLAPNITVDSEVVLQPKEEKHLPITINVPNIDEGTILGGIRLITEGNPEEKSSELKEGESNFIIKTEVVHAIAIQLDLPEKVEPSFSLGDAGFSIQGPNAFIEMINDSQMIQEGITGDYSIQDDNGNQLFNGTISPFKMAPNTLIRYPISWDYETLEEGDYSLTINMNVNNTKVSAEENFTIGNKQIEEYVEKTQPIVKQDNKEVKIPAWTWIIGGAIVLAGFMFWLGRRKA